MNKKIEKYLKQFDEGTRVDGSAYTFIRESASDKLKDSVRQAHGDKLPDDWTYNTYYSLLERLGDYDLAENSIDDVRHDLVDSMVDIYTKDLTEWLNSDIRNVYYLSEVLSEHDIKDGFQALAMAQYMAIDEVMNEVINLLSN